MSYFISKHNFFTHNLSDHESFNQDYIVCNDKCPFKVSNILMFLLKYQIHKILSLEAGNIFP